MDVLDVDGGFDVHEYRHRLKLLRRDGGSRWLENRDDLRCPACGRPFGRLFVTDDAAVSFASAPSGPICVVRTGGGSWS